MPWRRRCDRLALDDGQVVPDAVDDLLIAGFRLRCGGFESPDLINPMAPFRPMKLKFHFVANLVVEQ